VGGARIVERGQRPEQLQVRIGDLLHVGDGAQKLADTAVGEGLALQGHDHLVGRGQSVEGEDAQRRRAVDDHHVEFAARFIGGGQFRQRPLERVLAPGPHQQHGLGTGQVDIGR